MPDQLVLFGVNHKSAPVALRETCSFDPDRARSFFQGVRNRDASIENVVLSTCNRTEVYARIPVDDTPAGRDRRDEKLRGVLETFFETHRASPESFAPHLYFRHQAQAARHLFRLAGGLDSMILGEGQILRQIRDAFEFAREEGVVGRTFHRLFPAAIRTGRRVRRSTLLGEGCVTPGQAAAQIAETQLGTLAGKQFLILGSGKIAGLAAKSLRDRRVEKYYVVNRSAQRARDLVREIGGNGVACAQDELDALLERVDVIVSSTASPTPLVTRERLEGAVAARDGRPLVCIDLAVPRDISPDVRTLPGVVLRDIDDLQAVVQENIESRRAEIPRAESIVQRELRKFLNQMNWVHLDPVIRHLIDRFEELRSEELARVSGSLSPEQMEVFDRLSVSMMKKFIHFPIEKLKSLRDGDGLSPEEVRFLKKLFLNDV